MYIAREADSFMMKSASYFVSDQYTICYYPIGDYGMNKFF